MTKYPVRYWSESQKREVEIESMATPHLANAWRKATKAKRPFVHIDQLVALDAELCARGCTLDRATGQWAFPVSGCEPYRVFETEA